jgi:hypothetical protein
MYSGPGALYTMVRGVPVILAQAGLAIAVPAGQGRSVQQSVRDT